MSSLQPSTTTPSLAIVHARLGEHCGAHHRHGSSRSALEGGTPRRAPDKLAVRIEISDFVPHSSVPATTIDKYRGRVPDDLIEIWQQYGYGTFGGGFFKTIDPDFYLEQLGPEGIGFVPEADGEESIPVFATALADLVCWEAEGAGLATLIFRYRQGTSLGASLDTMFTLLYGQCVEYYCDRKFDYEKRETSTAMRVMVELQGPIER